ncbi:hypothetical protein BC831DRAFT_482955 [Entophlyctis helioformis]|nr:hypothetical protein BC831DRAFT_482955 [Entophlyctis helioformis]
MSHAEASLATLPTELTLGVLKYLDARSATRLASSCRHLRGVCDSAWAWELLLFSRFGNDKVPEDRTQCRARYQELHRASRSLVANAGLFVTWLDGESHYWTLRQDASATAGVCARLNNVCWFDIAGSFAGVKRGVYHPAIRYRTYSRPVDLTDLAVDVAVTSLQDKDAPSDCSTHTSTVLNITTPTRNWVYHVLPELHVGNWPGTDEYHTLTFHMFRHAGNWKSGLDVDGVFLLDPQTAASVPTIDTGGRKTTKVRTNAAATGTLPDRASWISFPPLSSFTGLMNPFGIFNSTAAPTSDADSQDMLTDDDDDDDHDDHYEEEDD